MKHLRGFTLLEFLIACAVLPIVIGAIGALYLEGRVASARIEAQIRLQREASLVHEFLSRDLRRGTLAKASAGQVEIRIEPDRSVIYKRTAAGLKRRSKGSSQLVSRRVRTVEVEAEDRRYLIRLRLEQTLLPGRVVKFERTSVVVKRR